MMLNPTVSGSGNDHCAEAVKLPPSSIAAKSNFCFIKKTLVKLNNIVEKSFSF